MGHINQVITEMEKWIKSFNLKNYVETGTGEGDCLEYALNYSFENFYSIEIYDQIYKKAVKKFDALSKEKGKNCKIYHGNSFKILPEIIKDLKGNTLFFLDAHFPGADFHYTYYNSEPDYNTRLPCEKEVEVITSLKDVTNDIIITDDLRLYESGPFTDGPNTLAHEISPTSGSKFLFDAFGKTHSLTRDFQSQGYMIITPKREE